MSFLILEVQIYIELAGEVENGLVVNKNTHRIITQKDIKDEDELVDLCVKENWNTDWYERYLNYFNFK